MADVDRGNTSDGEIRRALALSVRDAIDHTNMPGGSLMAIRAVMDRLVRAEPITVEEEGALLTSLDEGGWTRNPPFDAVRWGS